MLFRTELTIYQTFLIRPPVPTSLQHISISNSSSSSLNLVKRQVSVPSKCWLVTFFGDLIDGIQNMIKLVNEFADHIRSNPQAVIFISKNVEALQLRNFAVSSTLVSLKGQNFNLICISEPYLPCN